MSSHQAQKRALIAWSLYDFGNSAFTTIIITFVFSVYFSGTLVCSASWAGCLSDAELANLSLAERLSGTAGQAAWGYAMAFTGLVIGVLAPIAGAVADFSGRRKPWIISFSLLAIVCAASLYFMRPEPQFIIPAILLVALGNLGFELGIVFNNAMLPDLAPEKRIGFWSGFAWGLGYFGGLIALVICLALILTQDGNARLEATLQSNLVVAAWFFVFMLPLVFFVPDRPGTGLSLGQAVHKGLGQIAGTLKQIWHQPNMLRFLIARLLYIDGTNTLFAMGATYAALRHGMDISQIILFGILLNVTSGIGAMVFGVFDDRFGPKAVIQGSLIGLMLTGLPAIFAPNVLPDAYATWAFIALTSLAGLFVGPVQAASRSAMARMAPKAQMTEYFGILAFSGRITAFLGPFLVAVVTSMTGNLDWGMLPIVGFWLAGFVVMSKVQIRPWSQEPH